MSEYMSVTTCVQKLPRSAIGVNAVFVVVPNTNHRNCHRLSSRNFCFTHMYNCECMRARGFVCYHYDIVVYSR